MLKSDRGNGARTKSIVSELNRMILPLWWPGGFIGLMSRVSHMIEVDTWRMLPNVVLSDERL